MIHNKTFRISGLIMSFLTLLTLFFALKAIPISGAFAPGEALDYPYLNSGNQFPNDYIWMYLAIFMFLSFLVFVVIYQDLNRGSITSRLALISAKFSVIILVSTYFLQAEVLPINIILEQNNGVSLLTQYNPFGIFIASEVLGHFFLVFSLVLITPSLKNGRAERFLKLFLTLSFIGVVAAYIVLASIHGLEKMERFEVTIISISWIDLIVLGIFTFFKGREQGI